MGKLLTGSSLVGRRSTPIPPTLSMRLNRLLNLDGDGPPKRKGWAGAALKHRVSLGCGGSSRHRTRPLGGLEELRCSVSGRLGVLRLD